MIKIEYNDNVVTFKGHTTPDICAAVSSVMYTSVNLLDKYDNDCFLFKDYEQEDFVLISIYRHDNFIDMIINNMFDMLNDLIEDGNEDKIELKRS